jgi:arylsulfatase
LALAVLLVVSAISYAYQPDAPYLEFATRNQAKWAAEDKQISAKLAALEKRFGKKPNIIYILADDVGWGEMGWQGGGKHRGTPTPQLDKMAFEGIRFFHAYAEPSCTPSRIAIMTGRHPARTGLLNVLWPGQTNGLVPEEVTIAEVLSKAGYHTAMWGKWHLGEEPEHAPENQGFDYAYYGLFNGAPDAWPDSHALYETPTNFKAPFHDFPGEEEYKKRTGIDLNPAGYVGEKGKGRKPIPGMAGRLGNDRQDAFEEESIKQITAYIRDKAKSTKPFFIYWPTYTQQICGAPDYQNAPHVDRANAQASFMLQHNMHMKQLFDTLRSEGIAENTLVVWISDNGPMYAFWPTAGYSWLRGAKTDVLEGGVRVPAMAWWPGMIAPNQDPLDFVHITDLFTTAARLGGAMDNIPSDRVTDGIDQTALLLLGEGHSRRNYMFHYSGPELLAIRYENFKILMTGKLKGGVPEMEFYNVVRDPGEKYGAFYAGLYAVTPMQNILRDHMLMIKRFPHRPPEMPKGAEITPHD